MEAVKKKKVHAVEEEPEEFFVDTVQKRKQKNWTREPL